MLDTRVKDWSTEHGGEASERSYRDLFASIARFVVGAVAIGAFLFGAQKALPYVQNGAAVVGQVKLGFAQGSNLFRPSDKIRIVSFGNSKTLAGFQALTFDAALGANARSFNLAIPGDDRYVDLLETALSHGNAPTHVFVQGFPHSKQNADSLWTFLLDNKKMVNLIFPFREYVRDALIFAYEARAAGGLVRQYKSNAAQIEKLQSEHGYYFIKSQSHYAGDRLPDDYTLPTDRPNEVMKRPIDPADAEFVRLMRLADKYDFQVVLVPVAFRRGEFAAPPDADSEAANILRTYKRAHVIGPAYWIYETREFSDPVHLNPEGAERYTRQLAALFQHSLASGF